MKKKIEGFENYYIDSFGFVFNSKKGVQLKGIDSKKKYKTVVLSKNGQSKRFMVHRLVAQAFIPNPENKPQVNHIDGNVKNNNVENLEWVTNRENTIHAYNNGLKKRKLSNEDVEYIKNNYISRDKKFGAVPLSKKFGVSDRMIWVVAQKDWNYKTN